jgi:hypothetical protein
MGAYLHQDFDIFGDTPALAADQFLREEPRLAQLVPDEVKQVLATHTEDQLAELLVGLGCQVGPWAPDGTYRSSLERLASRAASLSKGGQG